MTKMDIGEMVAASMQEILASDSHQRFFKKAEKCCSCAKCGKDCPCKGDCNDCSMCSDTNHVHDDKCACGDSAQMATAINEIMDTLSKVAAIQEEIGLTDSAVSTLKAMNAMVNEMNKIAQDLGQDQNAVKAKDLIDQISGDTDSRRDWRQFSEDFPEEWELLKKRVDESHVGAEPVPSGLFDYVGPEGADTIPPEEAVANTDLPPESLVGQDPLPAQSPVDGFQALLEEPAPDTEVDPIEGSSYGPDKPTIPVPRNAFQRLDEWLKLAHEMEEEGPDFEDEEEPSRDMRGYTMKGRELEDMLGDEEPDYISHDEAAEMPDLFGLEPDIDPEDLSHSDDLMWASDLDGEIESGDFLDQPEDKGPGFTYGPDTQDKSMHDQVRKPGGSWVDYLDLSPEERLEHEMGAGLHDQLDMDPDELSYDDIPSDDEFSPGPESQAHEKIRQNLDNIEDEREHYSPVANSKYEFWG